MTGFRLNDESRSFARQAGGLLVPGSFLGLNHSARHLEVSFRALSAVRVLGPLLFLDPVDKISDCPSVDAK